MGESVSSGVSDNAGPDAAWRKSKRWLPAGARRSVVDRGKGIAGFPQRPWSRTTGTVVIVLALGLLRSSCVAADWLSQWMTGAGPFDMPRLILNRAPGSVDGVPPLDRSYERPLFIRVVNADGSCHHTERLNDPRRVQYSCNIPDYLIVPQPPGRVP